MIYKNTTGSDITFMNGLVTVTVKAGESTGFNFGNSGLVPSGFVSGSLITDDIVASPKAVKPAKPAKATAPAQPAKSGSKQQPTGGSAKQPTGGSTN